MQHMYVTEEDGRIVWIGGGIGYVGLGAVHVCGMTVYMSVLCEVNRIGQGCIDERRMLSVAVMISSRR